MSGPWEGVWVDSRAHMHVQQSRARSAHAYAYVWRIRVIALRWPQLQLRFAAGARMHRVLDEMRLKTT